MDWLVLTVQIFTQTFTPRFTSLDLVITTENGAVWTSLSAQ